MLLGIDILDTDTYAYAVGMHLMVAVPIHLGTSRIWDHDIAYHNATKHMRIK